MAKREVNGRAIARDRTRKLLSSIDRVLATLPSIDAETRRERDIDDETRLRFALERGRVPTATRVS